MSNNGKMEVKEDLQVERATKEIPNDEGAAKKVDVEAKVMERGDGANTVVVQFST